MHAFKNTLVFFNLVASDDLYYKRKEFQNKSQKTMCTHTKWAKEQTLKAELGLPYFQLGLFQLSTIIKFLRLLQHFFLF